MKFSFKNKKNWTLRLISISISILIWFYVLSSSQIQLEKSIKLHYILPERYAIQNVVPQEITFTLNGPRAFLRSFIDKVDVLKVDLNKRFIPGQKEYVVPVKSLGLSFPFGINVIKSNLKRLKINLERKKTKIVEIKVLTTGEIPSDHKMVESYIFPTKIHVAGPYSLMDKIKFIETFPIELNGLTGVGELKLGIVQNDSRLHLPFNDVTFHYNIKPTRANMYIKDIPIRFFGSKMVTNANIRKVNLMVLADNEDATINMNDIKVIAELPETSEGTFNIDLKAQLPKGLHLLEISPSKVELTVK